MLICFPAAAIYYIFQFTLLIEMNERHWHIHFATLRGWKMAAFTAAVWIATIAITAYAYPRIDEFANIWNDYLLP